MDATGQTRETGRPYEGVYMSVSLLTLAGPQHEA